MSQQALEELERVRKELLEKQQVCGWCGKKCQDSNHLYLHIVLRHINHVQKQ